MRKYCTGIGKVKGLDLLLILLMKFKNNFIVVIRNMKAVFSRLKTAFFLTGSVAILIEKCGSRKGF